jgi:hypothetical protein
MRLFKTKPYSPISFTVFYPIGRTGPTTTAPITTVLDLFPVFFPFFSPTERTLAHFANLGR